MAMATNITIRIDETTAREVKALAARRGMSLSQLVAGQLRAMLKADLRFDKARDRALKRLRRGYDLRWERPGAEPSCMIGMTWVETGHIGVGDGLVPSCGRHRAQRRRVANSGDRKGRPYEVGPPQP